MCGIIGGIRVRPDSLERAAESFAYRGPDSTHFFDDGKVQLGHHRLSIIDTSSAADQPFWDAAREIGIVFNGEIYNFRDIRAELATDYDFRTQSDTEVVVYAFKKWGVQCVQRFRGMFACAIYDRRVDKLYLLRDHAGIKPLYYAEMNGTFLFSSELKGITRYVRETGQALVRDARAIELYAVLGYVPSPHTLYQGIHKLPKMSWAEVDCSTPVPMVHIERYGLEASQIQSEDELAELIERRTLEHLEADVPVGLFFSGGTDSSLLATILHKHDINLKTYSVRMEKKQEDEAYFTAIADRLSVEPHVVDFGVPEFDEVYPLITQRIDEPMFDNSLFPTFYLAREAAKEVKVVLSGEGGDELFLGYGRQAKLAHLQMKREGVTWLDKLYKYTPSFPAKNALFERLFLFAGQALSYYLVCMSPAKDRSTVHAWATAKEALAQTLVEPTGLDREWYLENDLLKKLDMATSFASIEGRVPLLDKNVFQAAQKSSPGQHLEGGVAKSLLKKILARFLPKELVYRGKSGFGMDMRTYFSKSAYLYNDLLKAAQYLQAEGVIKNTVYADPLMYIRRYPNYCLSLIMLYYCLLNNEGRTPVTPPVVAARSRSFSAE